MRHLLLAAKRPFNKKAYLILVGLFVPAVFAIQPYLLTTTTTAYPGFWNMVLAAGIDLLLYAVLGAAGLWLASRIGLGMPLIEGWTERKPAWNRLPGVVGISILASILLILVKVLDAALAPVVIQIGEAQAESSPVNAIVPPAWQGFLAAFSAGITEENIFRLFGLSLLSWLGSLLFRSRSGRPALWLLWTANLLFALLFSLAHLPTAAQMGISLDAAIVIRTIIINGAGGVVFGWLYFSFGLESAMLAHISADVILHGFVPLVTQQAGTARSIVVGVIIGLAILLAAIWSARAILGDRKRFPQAAGPDVLQPAEAGLSRQKERILKWQ
jgi:Type II CAAX prenyl endopeptidase Rce1-like